jgi:hypothetical protein
LASPLVHWTHGNVGRGFLSLGLNVGLPITGAMIGEASDIGGLSIPLVVLAFTAWPIVDVAALSYEDPSASKRKNKSAMPSFSILPMLQPDKRGLSLVGQF